MTAVNAAPGKEQRMVAIIVQIAQLIVSVIALLLDRIKPKQRKK